MTVPKHTPNGHSQTVSKVLGPKKTLANRWTETEDRAGAGGTGSSCWPYSPEKMGAGLEALGWQVLSRPSPGLSLSSKLPPAPAPQLLGPGSFLPSSPDTRDGGSQQVLEQKEGRDTSSIYPC